MKTDTTTTAVDLAVIMGEAPALTLSDADAFLKDVRQIADTLHAVYVRQCNGHRDEGAALCDDERARRLEARLMARFEAAGLGLYLNTDPRGNPVGILTPITGRSNTMGGASAGWRL